MKLGNLFKRPWIAAATAAILVAAGLTLTTVGTAQAATGCQADYTISSQWPGGFGATIQITNLGTPTSAWTLTWSFTAGQTIQTLWNGTYTQSGGNITVTNAPYNGSLTTGATTNIGFNATWNTTNPTPTTFTLNGTTCTATGSPSTHNPQAPHPPPPQPPHLDHTINDTDHHAIHLTVNDTDGGQLSASVHVPLDVDGPVGAAAERVGLAQGLHRRGLQRQAHRLRLGRQRLRDVRLDGLRAVHQLVRHGLGPPDRHEPGRGRTHPVLLRAEERLGAGVRVGFRALPVPHLQ